MKDYYITHEFLGCKWPTYYVKASSKAEARAKFKVEWREVSGIYNHNCKILAIEEA